MPNNNGSNKASTMKQLADDVMHTTLQRASEGSLRGSDAERCASIMTAFRNWSEASLRSDMLEMGEEIIGLAQELKSRETLVPEKVLEQTRQAVRNAVISAMRETMAEEFTKANSSRRRGTAKAR